MEGASAPISDPQKKICSCICAFGFCWWNKWALCCLLMVYVKVSLHFGLPGLHFFFPFILLFYIILFLFLLGFFFGPYFPILPLLCFVFLIYLSFIFFSLFFQFVPMYFLLFFYPFLGFVRGIERIIMYKYMQAWN